MLEKLDALRIVYGESDQLPGLVVDRYGDWLAVQVLTLGMERRLVELRAALEQVFAPRGAALVADSPLRTLGEDSRTVVLLDLDGLSEAEIAEVMGCAPGTVKSRLSRARAALRELLADYKR